MSYGPIVGGLLDAIAGVTAIVAKRIDDKRHRWQQLLVDDPPLAALTLNLAAEDLDGSVDSLPKWRWRAAARRKAKARTLRRQAVQILKFARDELCDAPMRRPL